jgi:glucoamylase
MKALVDRLIATGDKSLESTLNDIVKAQSALQQVNNPSGSFSSGGLGEPQFLKDGRGK